VRRNDLDSSVRKPRCNGGCRFGPTPSGIFSVPIGHVAVPLVHPSLIAHRPWDARPIIRKLALDYHVSFGIHVRMITIYDVDIAPRDELDGIVVQVIPDSIANDPTTYPTVIDGEGCDSTNPIKRGCSPTKFATSSTVRI